MSPNPLSQCHCAACKQYRADQAELATLRARVSSVEEFSCLRPARTTGAPCECCQGIARAMKND